MGFGLPPLMRGAACVLSGRDDRARPRPARAESDGRSKQGDERRAPLTNGWYFVGAYPPGNAAYGGAHVSDIDVARTDRGDRWPGRRSAGAGAARGDTGGRPRG